jgi:hypothetical protein
MPREATIPAKTVTEDFLSVEEVIGKYVRTSVGNLMPDGKSIDPNTIQVYLVDGANYTTLTSNPNWSNEDLWHYVDLQRKT